MKRWASLGSPSLGPEVQEKIIAGVAEEAAGRSIAELEGMRDRFLLAILRLRQEMQNRQSSTTDAAAPSK
jgi:carnitine 3-dehydrogenase